MFAFLKLKWLLKVIYFISKLSGFLFISVDFKGPSKFVMQRNFLSFIIFGISFGVSSYANTFDGYLPISVITHSYLTEIGINLFTHFSLISMCVLKLLNIIYKRRFFEIVSKLYWCHIKVQIENWEHKSSLKAFFFAAREIRHCIGHEASNRFNIIGGGCL